MLLLVAVLLGTVLGCSCRSTQTSGAGVASFKLAVVCYLRGPHLSSFSSARQRSALLGSRRGSRKLLSPHRSAEHGGDSACRVMHQAQIYLVLQAAVALRTLSKRFACLGRHTTAPVSWLPPADQQWVRSMHSTEETGHCPRPTCQGPSEGQQLAFPCPVHLQPRLERDRPVDRGSTCCRGLFRCPSAQLPTASPLGVLLLLDCWVAPARIPSASACATVRAGVDDVMPTCAAAGDLFCNHCGVNDEGTSELFCLNMFVSVEREKSADQVSATAANAHNAVNDNVGLVAARILLLLRILHAWGSGCCNVLLLSDCAFTGCQLW